MGSSFGIFDLKEFQRKTHRNPIPIGFYTIATFDSNELLDRIPWIYCSIPVKSHEFQCVFGMQESNNTGIGKHMGLKCHDSWIPPETKPQDLSKRCVWMPHKKMQEF